jgi:hypothetical protein
MASALPDEVDDDANDDGEDDDGHGTQAMRADRHGAPAIAHSMAVTYAGLADRPAFRWSGPWLGEPER